MGREREKDKRKERREMIMWIGIVILVIISSIIILGMMILLIGKLDKRIPREDESRVRGMVSIIREKREEEEREKRVYAYKKIMNEPFGGILRSDNGERRIGCKTKGELIPIGLSEGEKRLLEEFYGKGQ